MQRNSIGTNTARRPRAFNRRKSTLVSTHHRAMAFAAQKSNRESPGRPARIGAARPSGCSPHTRGWSDTRLAAATACVPCHCRGCQPLCARAGYHKWKRSRRPLAPAVRERGVSAPSQWDRRGDGEDIRGSCASYRGYAAPSSGPFLKGRALRRRPRADYISSRCRNNKKETRLSTSEVAPAQEEFSRSD